MEHSLNDLTVAELLRLHVGIGEQLRTRGITRGENVPTGDFAEFLFCRAYGWEQAGNSEKAFDATDSEGKRYQIKGRRIHKRTSSMQLSAIRDLEGFDILAAVLFDHYYDVSKAVLIPNEVVRRRAKHAAHDNKWNFLLTDDVWREAGVRDVTVILRTAWKQLCTASEVTGAVDLSSLSEAQLNKLQEIVDEAQADQRRCKEQAVPDPGSVRSHSPGRGFTAAFNRVEGKHRSQGHRQEIGDGANQRDAGPTAFASRQHALLERQRGEARLVVQRRPAQVQERPASSLRQRKRSDLVENRGRYCPPSGAHLPVPVGQGRGRLRDTAVPQTSGWYEFQLSGFRAGRFALGA